MNDLLSLSLSAKTAKLYSLALKTFNQFVLGSGFVKAWPPTLDQIVAFVCHLSTKGYAHSTVNAYLSGIAFHIKIRHPFHFDPTQTFIVRKLLQGLQRRRHKVDKRLPMTLDILKHIPSALASVCSSSYEALLFSAAFCIAFFGFLRIGEIAIVSKDRDAFKVVQFRDIKMYDQEVHFTVRYSKTDQLGKSTTLVFTEKNDKTICPVRRLKDYMKVRPNVEGPLIIHYNSNPLSKYQFSAVLNKALKFLNLNHNIKGHSFRIGAATLATIQSVPDSQIKVMGRWSENSSSFKRYIRLDKISA